VQARKEKNPASIFVIFTDPLGVTDIGGTLAKHAKAGGKVLAVILWEYDGEVMKQIANMSSILGIESQVLGYKRGEVQADLPTKKRIVKMIREFRPDIAVTFDPDFAANTTYGDHVATHQLMMEALGLCYRQNFAPEQLKDGLETHFVRNVYYPFWGLRGQPDVVVDITETFELKLKATLALTSQSEFGGKFLRRLYPENVLKTMLPAYDEVKTNDTKLGEAWQKDRRKVTVRFMGEQVDVPFGEPFKCVSPIRLDYLTI
jgi:LmbE family N-acetylglucosaminyl deacetylase